MAELSPLAAGLTPRELSDIVRAHFGNTPFAFGVLPGGARCACGRLCKGEGTGAFPAREAFPLPVDGHSLHNYALLPLLFLPLYSIVVRFPRKNAKMRGRSVANS